VSVQDRPACKHYVLLTVLVFGGLAALPYAVGVLCWAAAQFGL
jgi:hypothetical protein